MKEIDHSPLGRLDSAPPDSNEPPRRVGRLLLWPLAGVIALSAVMIAYRPLDDTLIWWMGGVPCAISYILTRIAWARAKRRDDVRSFFPLTTWLALGCLLVPAILFLNGALGHSPVERHRQVVTRTILTYGRRGSVYYSLELTSWRPPRSHEKIGVPEWKYLDFKVGDPVIVETRTGALGIPLLVSVHWPE
jgi:hypothetical protein